MATPNYGYEKRQKELAKKRKKEEKLKAKADRKAPGGEFLDSQDGSLAPDDRPADAAPQGDLPPPPQATA
ncbi:hypothetical protein PSQ40_01645 [Curvibacter sp. HBC61]|uniref:Uncharacterized protein n=1 Tax=Curvibacter cyanobacteriorum TaxID=3026422 RepID=A0ABT5MVC5_9BURK|nr:hypothetical protein [Curvibacter sp. HBC61]MDD0837264.1 hypothetical protein [Curvibacter sp. HBC61]